MLNEREIEFRYREYQEEVLDVRELNDVFRKLAMTPEQLLRGGDAQRLGLSGNESADELIELMTKHPKLLQRPILMSDEKAVLGRPIENLLEML
ncbi:MAG: arsenate reductase [Planctomycetota bacterium]